MAIIQFKSPINQRSQRPNSDNRATKPQLGGHTMTVVGFETGKSKSGADKVVITLDFTEGPHKGYFKYPLQIHQSVSSEVGEDIVKGIISIIIRDNPGLISEQTLAETAFDTSKLVGLKAGVILGTDERGYIRAQTIVSIEIAAKYEKTDAPIPQRKQEAVASVAAAKASENQDFPF
jgi:hypothetical protein